METKRPSIERIVRAWREMLPGAYVPRNRDDRKAAYLDLFDTLLGYGYTRDEILLGSNKKVIIKYSYNEHHPIKEKKERWQGMVEEDFERAVETHPKMTEDKIVIQKFDDSQATYQTPPAKPFVPTEAKVEKSEEKAPEPETKEEKEDKNLIPQEVWDAMPSAKAEYDEELVILLGLKK